MKKNTYIIIAVALMSVTACTNDLNVEPLDPTVSTDKRVYADAANYQKALNKIYYSFPLFELHFSLQKNNNYQQS